MITTNPKVCAVVVTFNRKNVLLKCISALLKQTYSLNSIFIIDGPSTDGTEKLLLEKGFIKESPPANTCSIIWGTRNVFIDIPIEFHYFRLYKDVGGSGGFYEGFKRAYKCGCDWIWVMDDDVIPSHDCLEKLIFAIKDNFNVAARPALVNAADFSPLFAGGIFSRNIISKIGLPLKEFFIYWDDIEYMLRAKKAGVKIIDVKDAKVYHRDWTLKGFVSRNILGKKIQKPLYPKGRKYYYIQRNKFYTYIRHRKVKLTLYEFFIMIPRDLNHYLILNQPERVLCILKGTLDAVLGRTGKCEWAHKTGGLL
ncbi:MAG: glycosyltransferase family 2 protein [Crenarchaeota archaeon]|nr:glycosyltransferase family 2 protein [Thermoproteota archaeon]